MTFQEDDMKLKAKTKKIIVLSVMVVLLVATGVLNWALNDKLLGADDGGGQAAVTETFFASYRSDREAARESEFLYLDAIMSSETSSAEAKAEAEQQKLGLVERMETEMRVEALVKAKGFEDAIVTMSDEGVNVVVGAGEVTDQQRMQIYDIIQSETEFSAGDVKIILFSRREQGFGGGDAERICPLRLRPRGVCVIIGVLWQETTATIFPSFRMS